MRVLVTAGNTQTPIDQVRCITNVFSGRTGTRIACEARRRGHAVTLLTSHPEVVKEIAGGKVTEGPDWKVHPYRTFDELHQLMARLIPFAPGQPGLDAIVHVAAVSDYRVEEILVPKALPWPEAASEPRAFFDDARAGKVKSHHPEVWLRMTPTPKLVDRIRGDWGFTGILVKFKLEVGLTPEALQETAETSRRQSSADFMVANTLEGMGKWALVGPGAEGRYENVSRLKLAAFLLDRIEQRLSERK